MTELAGEVAVRIKGDLTELDKDLAEAKRRVEAFDRAAATSGSAQSKLSGSLTSSEAALAKLTSGVDIANAALTRLEKAVLASSASTTKLDAAKQTAAKTTVQEARASEGATVARRQEAAANDRLTESVNRQAAAYASTARARAAAGVDAWGRTPAEVTSHVAATRSKASPATPVAAVPVSANTQAELTKAQALTRTASEGARATGMLTAGLMSAIVPANLLSFAIYGLSSAAIEWATETLTGASSVEKAFERHKKLIDEIAASFPKAAEAARAYEEEAAKLPQAVALADARQSREQSQRAFEGLWGRFQAGLNTASTDIGSGKTLPGYEQFAELADQMAKGTITAEELQKRIGEIRLDPNLRKDVQATANDFQELAKQVVKAAAEIESSSIAGSNIQQTWRTESARRRQQYEIDNAEAMFRSRQQRDLALQAIGARSPQELADVARAREAAKPVTGGESAEARKFNEDAKAAVAYAQALQQITDAQDARIRAMNQGLASQQLELSLVGKTAGETAKLRFEFEHIQQLREEAARNHTIVDPTEIDLIRQAAEETGKYVDALARANVAKDLAFEHDQLRRTTQDAAIASMQRSAGLPVDLGSPEAQAMRDNLEFSQAKETAKSFLSTFQTTLVSSGGDVGKAMGAAILDALMNSMTKQWGVIFDQLAIAFATAVTGQKSGSGGIASAGASVARNLFGTGANDNYAPGAVTRAPLADIGAKVYRDAIASIESAGSGGYGALGPIHKTMGQALGRYQVMEANLPAWSKAALGRNVGRSEFLGSPSIQDAIFDDRFGGYVNKYGASGAASMWFTGRPSAPNATDVLGTTGSAYVDKFNAALGQATTGLGGFDNTVTSAIKAMSDIASNGFDLSKLTAAGGFHANTSLSAILGYTPQAQSSGGGGGLLGSLFGWVGKLFGFADGTENAPPGWAWVGERGPELRKLRAGDVIRSNPRSMEMVANSNGQSRPTEKIDLHVNVYGGSGDDHVRMLAEQGARKVVGEYNRGQVSGGFGTTQKRYNSMKG